MRVPNKPFYVPNIPSTTNHKDVAPNERPSSVKKRPWQLVQDIQNSIRLRSFSKPRLSIPKNPNPFLK